MTPDLCGSLKSLAKCHNRLFSPSNAQLGRSFASWANAIDPNKDTVSDKRMQLGLEYIIFVTSISTIPHLGMRVAWVYLLECQIGDWFVQNFQKLSRFVKSATSTNRDSCLFNEY